MHGEDGALMIDGGLAANADALLKAVKERTGNSRIHTLINTHWHPEQTGANEAVGRDGGVIIAHEKTRMYLSNTVTFRDVRGPPGPLPEEARPNKTTYRDGSLKFAGQRIDYDYLPAAHTDGDLYVHFPQMNVLVAGGAVSGEEVAHPGLPQRRLAGRPRARPRKTGGSCRSRHSRRACQRSSDYRQGYRCISAISIRKLFIDHDCLLEHGAWVPRTSWNETL